MAKPTNLTTGVKRKWYERLRAKAQNGDKIRLEKAANSENKQGLIIDSSLSCRHEIKYIINESLAVAVSEFIKPYVQPDRYCRSQPKVSYPIATLYLDSDNLQLCQETLRGQKNRFKLRIRSYTDELDYPRFFEIKRRAGSVIIKSRAQVLHQQIASLLSGLGWSRSNDDGETCLRQFILYMNSIGAGPVVRTRYIRQAFEGTVDKRVRITFDRDLSYKITRCADVGLNGSGWRRMCLNQVILEIKFTGCYPAWISRMVKYFGLRQRSISKYASSIKRASWFELYTTKA